MSDAIPEARLPALRGLLAAQLAHQARLLVHAPRALFGGVLLPLLLLALHGGGAHSDPRAQARLVAGVAVLGMLSTAYITHAGALVVAREAGVLKRWRAAPLPAWCYFSARIGATVLVAAAGGAVAVVAGAVAYGLRVDARGILTLAVVLVLGSAVGASIATAISGLIPSADAAWPLLAATYLPVVGLSGGFGSVAAEPGWLATLVDGLPARPIVDGASRALGATAQHGPGLTLHDLTVLVIWGSAGVLVALRSFRWQPRRPARHRAARDGPPLGR